MIKYRGRGGGDTFSHIFFVHKNNEKLTDIVYNMLSLKIFLTTQRISLIVFGGGGCGGLKYSKKYEFTKVYRG